MWRPKSREERAEVKAYVEQKSLDFHAALEYMGIHPQDFYDTAIIKAVERFKALEERVERIERGGY
jgi:hypothetical protein